VVDHRRVDEALAHGRRDLQLEHQIGEHVERRRPDDRMMGLEHAGRDHGRDRVGRIVEAVHEGEREGERD